MIKPGIVSVTFRKKTPREVVEIVKKAGLYAIEWGSDVHVPQGDLELAREIRKMTEDAGIEIPSYGSYYSVANDLDFAPFVATAKELGAGNIRIWSGNKSASILTADEKKILCGRIINACDMAAKEGMTISLEYHNDSLTDTCDGTISLLNELDIPNLYTYWQQPLDVKAEDQLPQLKKLYKTGKIKNLHVYEYDTSDGKRVQLPLSLDLWREYFGVVNDNDVHYAFIEFVSGYPDEDFIKDAKTLLSI